MKTTNAEPKITQISEIIPYISTKIQNKKESSDDIETVDGPAKLEESGKVRPVTDIDMNNAEPTFLKCRRTKDKENTSHF